MLLDCFLFGRPVQVIGFMMVSGSPLRADVIFTPLRKLSTPCGTIQLPAGKPVRFTTVELEGGKIIPISKGDMRPEKNRGLSFPTTG